jgi:hypothetical protein
VDGNQESGNQGIGNDADAEALLLSRNPEFMQIIKEARAEFAAGKTLTLEEMKRSLLVIAKGSGGNANDRSVC